jgi:hypothetical protein
MISNNRGLANTLPDRPAAQQAAITALDETLPDWLRPQHLGIKRASLNDCQKPRGAAEDVSRRSTYPLRSGQDLRKHFSIPMQRTNDNELRELLIRLKAEHRDLDAEIVALETAGSADIFTIKRLKKRKLALKDRMISVEDQLFPDIIA